MSDPDPSSPADPPLPLTSPRTPLQLSFPFLREGSRIWERERKPPQPGELPSPLPTKRTRTYSAWVQTCTVDADGVLSGAAIKITVATSCDSQSLSLSVFFCLSSSAGQCEPSQVLYLKACAKTSPGLRVMDSYAPLMEERTSLSTSLSESPHWVVLQRWISLVWFTWRPTVLWKLTWRNWTFSF